MVGHGFILPWSWSTSFSRSALSPKIWWFLRISWFWQFLISKIGSLDLLVDIRLLLSCNRGISRRQNSILLGYRITDGWVLQILVKQIHSFCLPLFRILGLSLLFLCGILPRSRHFTVFTRIVIWISSRNLRLSSNRNRFNWLSSSWSWSSRSIATRNDWRVPLSRGVHHKVLIGPIWFT